jgi:hypothetical protein
MRFGSSTIAGGGGQIIPAKLGATGPRQLSALRSFGFQLASLTSPRLFWPWFWPRAAPGPGRATHPPPGLPRCGSGGNRSWVSRVVPCGPAAPKPVGRAQLELGVHLDGVERADLDADLAAHADREIDVEHLRLKLEFAGMIRLLDDILDDVNALRRTFLLADLARHTAQPRRRVLSVIHQKRKIPRVRLRRQPFLGILHRDQPIRTT